MRVPTGDLLVRSHRRRRATIDGERKVKIEGRRQNGLKLRAGVLWLIQIWIRRSFAELDIRYLHFCI